MLTVTETARRKVLDFIAGQDDEKDYVLRVLITGLGSSGFQYEFYLDEAARRRPEDRLVETGGLRLVMDPRTAEKMKGATLDWKDDDQGEGFAVTNPNEPDLDQQDPLVQGLLRLLETEINPSLASHGGHAQLVDVQGSRVFLRLGGGCRGCGMANATLKQGIEARIRELFPQVEEVVDTTDHAGGTNPYY